MVCHTLVSVKRYSPNNSKLAAGSSNLPHGLVNSASLATTYSLGSTINIAKPSTVELISAPPTFVLKVRMKLVSIVPKSMSRYALTLTISLSLVLLVKPLSAETYMEYVPSPATAVPRCQFMLGRLLFVCQLFHSLSASKVYR